MRAGGGRAAAGVPGRLGAADAGLARELLGAGHGLGDGQVAEAFRVAGVIAGAGDPLPSRREFYVALWGRVGPEYRGSWMARAARRAGPAEMRVLLETLAAL